MFMDYKLTFKKDGKGNLVLIDISFEEPNPFAIPKPNLPKLKDVKTFWKKN